MSKNLVLIPTYNERENVENMLRTVFALPEDFHVLIIDDGRWKEDMISSLKWIVISLTTPRTLSTCWQRAAKVAQIYP